MESEHPRDPDGKFKSGIGSASAPLKWKNPAGRVANVYKDPEGKWQYQLKTGSWVPLESSQVEKVEKTAYYHNPYADPDFISKHDPDYEKKAAQKQEETINEGIEKEYTPAELKKKLHDPETHKTILEAYKGGYSTGSIAKSMGLKQDKNTRSAIRALLRKAGIYKEKGSPVQEVVKIPSKPYEPGKLTAMAEKYVKNMASGEHAFGNQSHSKAAFHDFCKEASISSSAIPKAQYACQQWTGSSHSKGAAQMKAVACEVYGKDIEFEPKLQYPASEVKADAAAIKDVLLAQRDFTQAWVKEHGAKIVYRGLRGKVVEEIKKQLAEKGEVELTANVLSSWSESKAKATSFGKGGVVLTMPVDPNHVWACYGASPHIFANYSTEKEYVIGLPGKTFTISKEAIAFV